MSRFDSVLVVQNASPLMLEAERCAAWIAEALGSRLHRHPTPEGRAILEAIAVHDAKLVVAAGQVIQSCPVPALVLPTSYREALPWRSMIVAMSGEQASDEALEVALAFASDLNLSVIAAHCEGGRGAAALGAYADALQHEVPGRMDEMLRGVLRHTPAEAGRIDRMLLSRGDPAQALLDGIARHQPNVLALGWRGVFAPHRAPVLRRLLDEASCALLIVRRPDRTGVWLKVGQEIDPER